MTCVSVGRGLAFGGDTFFSQTYGSANKKKMGIYLQKCEWIWTLCAFCVSSLAGWQMSLLRLSIRWIAVASSPAVWAAWQAVMCCHWYYAVCILLCSLYRDTGLLRKFFLKYAGHFGEKYVGKYTEFGEICAKICGIYAAYMRHYGKMWHKWRVRMCLCWTKCAEMLENAIGYAEICDYMRFFA